MDRNQEILACFQQEIAEISNAEIAKLHQEMDAIQERTKQELNEAAKENAQRWYEQEAEELTAQHAIAMSHLNDETHHKLMKERTALVNELFEEVKAQIQAYRCGNEYVTSLKAKLQTWSKDSIHATLQVAKCDETLLPQLLKELDQTCQGECVNDIQLGGFRLVLHSASKVIDETYDSALLEAKEHFLQTSGLIIA